MRSNRILAAASLLLLSIGCGGSSDTGKVSVLLKDAPASFSAAVVTISEVDLVGSGGTTVLTTKKTTTDLLTLANDTATLLADAEVPAGTYSQLRFVITGAYVEVGGVIYASSPTYEGLPSGATVGGTLQMPSYGQSGLKVDLPGGAVSVGTGSRVLLVDFDVSQSFGQVAGGSGGWVMHPVMQATELELTGSVTATLALGTGVTLPGTTTLAGFSAVLTPGAGGSATTLPLTATGSGAYGVTYKYLVPGSYSLAFTAPTGVTSFVTSPSIPATLTVTSGQSTTAAFIITSAQ